MRRPDHQQQHQANERTFLAWLRTSIALIGFGFAIARFGLFLRELRSTMNPQPAVPHRFFNSESLGVALVAFGIFSISLAAWEYQRVYRSIERGSYKPNLWLIGVMTAAVVILGLLSLPLIL